MLFNPNIIFYIQTSIFTLINSVKYYERKTHHIEYITINCAKFTMIKLWATHFVLWKENFAEVLPKKNIQVLNEKHVAQNIIIYSNENLTNDEWNVETVPWNWNYYTPS